ncbi:MAG: RNA methyltransferase, partial [Clostridia bacterium]|nr:RNA methyltransferase [Clostridia bacterium]
VPPHLFAKIADTKTPQGILCTCRLPKQPPLPASGHYMYCDRVRDPGNLGSIIRSADALGFDGIMLSEACVDPFSPKLVRSTMGSLFHTKLYTGMNAETLQKLQEKGFHLAISALTEESIIPKDFTIEKNVILAVGNESSGVSKNLLALADSVIKIPMAGSAESLNVAAAAAILMYECKARRLS